MPVVFRNKYIIQVKRGKRIGLSPARIASKPRTKNDRSGLLRSFGVKKETQRISTSSMWKFSSLPAISWLASKVMEVSSLAVTFTGTG